jgi:hypothetical protein
MDSEIVLVRNSDGYRVLFGHLRLTTILMMSSEAMVNVKGEHETVKVVRTAKGLYVMKNNEQLPLLKN